MAKGKPTFKEAMFKVNNLEIIHNANAKGWQNNISAGEPKSPAGKKDKYDPKKGSVGVIFPQ